jgi:5'-nucleotidase
VAAALEGTVIGIPSLAISLAATWPEHAREHHWETAAAVAVEHARDVLADGLPPLTLLNINVPNVPPNATPATRWTMQGRKRYRERLDRREDPRGAAYYWLWGTFDPNEIAADTDLAAVRDGFVSVTPITIDRTNHALLAQRSRSPVA